MWTCKVNHGKNPHVDVPLKPVLRRSYLRLLHATRRGLNKASPPKIKNPANRLARNGLPLKPCESNNSMGAVMAGRAERSMRLA